MSHKQFSLAKSQRGFTIVELMIATTVLSTILVIVTVIMISIGNLYYKGINQARVQDDVRSISNELSQHLRLSDGFTTDGGTDIKVPRAYCIGTTRYTYIDNIQLDPSATYKHVLWRDTLDISGGACAPVDLTAAQPSASGTELIAPRSRLTAFSITGSSPYNLTVGMAYGDSDLLCDSGYSAPPPDCEYNSGTSLHMQQVLAGTAAVSGQILCKDAAGGQFCATATLSTTVVRRLTSL